ncbi:MAG: tetratricopeptide repeat protein [Acidobacteria bacterium]|nr:tetratricopeptide repeat protein [Acidobacteriota bacterium]
MIKKSWIITGITLLLLTTSSAYGRLFDWEKAVSLYKQGQFRAAIEEFQKVVKEVPDHPDSWKFIGLAYYQLKEYQSAIQPLEKAQELKRKEGRNDPDLVRALGQAYLSLKKYEQALPYFEIITRMQMNVAANFYMLGVIYSNLNRGEEAADAFQKSVKLDPKDGDSWYYLGVQQFRSGKINEAIISLRNGIEASPKNPEMLGLLAEALLRQGAAETDGNKGNTLFEEAIRVATNLKAVRDNADSAELLGRAYLAAQKYTNAELMLSRALEGSKQPGAALYFNLGYAHAQNKSWVRAAEMLAQADKLNPSDLNTLYYLGFVYENLRRYPQALDAYSRAYEASGRNNADLKASIDRVTPMIKQ